MAKTEHVRYERHYIHTPKWRAVHASPFRTAHCLFDHCDDFGLVAIQPVNTLRYFLERRDAREDHITNDIRELQDYQILYTYKHGKHGLIACLPDFAIWNPKKFPKPSVYLPVPDTILFAEPDYADVIIQYQAQLGGTTKPSDGGHGKPTVAQAISLWNAFASEHSREGHRLPQASITPDRISHWNARTKEALFDLEAILKTCLESDWLMGKVKGRTSFFVLTFDFITDGPNNYVKILEGKYRTTAGANRTGNQGTNRTTFVPDVQRIRSIGQDPGKR